MNHKDCNIVRDLLPLYMDKCCSEESCTAVEAHLKECPECRLIMEDMASVQHVPAEPSPDVKLSRINDWKASALQSVLLLLSFGIITVGVAIEASVGSGFGNGFFAYNLVVPATGFMLSLVNWYFVKLYKSRRSFSNHSALITFYITIAAWIWWGFHYEVNLFEIFTLAESPKDVLEILYAFTAFGGIGLWLTAIFTVVSKALSNAYARMLGKEYL